MSREAAVDVQLDGFLDEPPVCLCGAEKGRGPKHSHAAGRITTDAKLALESFVWK